MAWVSMGAETGDKAGAQSPHLDETEQAQAQAHTQPRALVIHEIVREEGEAGLKRPSSTLAFSALAGGLSMGFSFVGQAVLRSGLPDTPWRHLIDGLGYSLGFVFVILGRQQLFTESTLTVVLPVLMRRTGAAVLSVLRFWLIVLAANIAGTWIAAWLMTTHGLFEQPVVEALHALAAAPFSHDFVPTALKAIVAGWLIALMVWILPSARSAQILVIVVIAYIVAAAQLTHVIAGSVESAYAVISGDASLAEYFIRFLVPTLLGNVIGGVTLVALLNHAGVVSEMHGQSGTSPEGEL